MLSIEYLTDQNGQPKAVVIPIELWRQVFPQEDMSCEEFTEGNISINAGKEAEVNLENEPALVRKHRLRLH